MQYNDMKQTIIGILILVLLIVGIYLYKKHFKSLKVPSVCLITGGVKTGKSLLAVKLAVKDYKKRHRAWWIKTRIFRKKVEEPMFYTNCAIWFKNCKSKKVHKLQKNIVKVELAHLLREKRFNYGSVVYICESSLMADNMDIRDSQRNAELSMFNKLFGHSTKGGVLYYDTQSPLDNHYSIKRVISTYFFIQKSVDFWLFRVLYVREMINNDLGENNFVDDVETSVRKVLILRKWYKRYDRYYFSYLTDKLSHKNKRLRFYKGELVSFNPLYRELSMKRKVKKVCEN